MPHTFFFYFLDAIISLYINYTMITGSPDTKGSCEHIEWTADKRWSYRLGVGRGGNSSSP